MTDNKGPQFDRNGGSLYDRGRADSYYCRAPDPHWYPDGGKRTPAANEAEKAEYMQGFDDNEKAGNFKDWG